MFYVRPGPEGPMRRTTPSGPGRIYMIPRPLVRAPVPLTIVHTDGRLDLDRGTSARLRRVTGLAL